MLSTRYLLFCLALLGLLGACKPREEELDPNPEKALRFSVDDTLFFDTVFTERTTITQRIKVFNDNDGAILLEDISMEAGASSPYSFYANGRPGPVVQNLQILGKDSAYILISGKLNPSRVDTPLVYEDRVQFRVKGKAETQKVVVLAKGQDAIYLTDKFLSKDTTFRASKPIVVFGYVFVDSLYTLTLEPGTRMHFYKDSYLIVKGTLKAKGTPEKRIIFTGTRLERYYDYVPDQWGYIAFEPSSRNNEISHAIVENGLRGVQVNVPTAADPRQPDLIIDNTLIRNVADIGLSGYNARITGANLVVADCGNSYITGQMGGSYRYAHCTVAQSGNTPFNRKSVAVAFTDFFETADKRVYVRPTPEVFFFNNLIAGTLIDEIGITRPPTAPNTLVIDTGRIRHNVIWGRRNLGFNTTTNRFSRNMADFTFQAPFSYDFRPDSAAYATAGGVLGTTATRVSDLSLFFGSINLFKDFAGKDRDPNNPFVGAYQKKE
jgi:hypothetical protein